MTNPPSKTVAEGEQSEWILMLPSDYLPLLTPLNFKQESPSINVVQLALQPGGFGDGHVATVTLEEIAETGLMAWKVAMTITLTSLSWARFKET